MAPATALTGDILTGDTLTGDTLTGDTLTGDAALVRGLAYHRAHEHVPTP
jgi:hypothetical protein